MRILHVTERFGPSVVGGAQRSVESLAKSHAAGGNEVSVVCISDETQESEPPIYPFPVHYVPISWVSRTLRKPRLNKALSAACYFYEGNIRTCDPKIRKVIDDFKPQIINTHILTGIPETVWKLGLERRIPVVHTIRDYFITCARSSMFKGGASCRSPCAECRFFTLRRRSLVRQVNGIVGISGRLIDIHNANGVFRSDQLTCVIPNSIDFEIRAANAYAPPSPFVIGFLGRIVQTKGVEQLIRAFARAAIPDGRLKIAGDGVASYVERLKGLAGSAPVEFLGRVDAESFYEQCSAIAIPSLWEEPFGRVVAEALLMGVPVICSDRGAFPEILRRFPGGLITQPQDIDKFAADLRLMRSALDRYRSYLGSNRLQVAGYFSSKAVGERYIDFYNDFANARCGT